jgi:hypothetical protein
MMVGVSPHPEVCARAKWDKGEIQCNQGDFA